MFISIEIGSLWRTILGHPQLIECMGICILSLAHGSEQRGSDVRFAYCEKTDLEFFSLNSTKVRALGWPLLGFFSGFF